MLRKLLPGQLIFFPILVIRHFLSLFSSDNENHKKSKISSHRNQSNKLNIGHKQ